MLLIPLKIKKDDRLKFILDKVYHVLYIETKRGLTCVSKVTVSLFKKNAEQGDLDIEVFIFLFFTFKSNLNPPWFVSVTGRK